MLINNIEKLEISTSASSFSFIDRIADAIRWLTSRILSIFQKKVSDGVFDIEAQIDKTPSLWNRACAFASDHKVAICVVTAVGVVAICALAYYANSPKMAPSLPKMTTPLSISNSYVPPSSIPDASASIPDASASVPPSPIPITEPQEKLPYSDWLQEKTTLQSGNPNSPIALFSF